MKFTAIAAAHLLAIGFASPAQANLITNGGFEAAAGQQCTSAPNWAGSGAFVNDTANTLCLLNPSAPGAHSGQQYAAFGAVGGLDSISQDVVTVAGQTYTLSFWLAGDLGTPNQFTASWDGNEVFNQIDIPGNTYALHSFDFVAADSLTTIAFGGRNDPTWLHLDDVSVELANAVPEPGSFALFGLALTGLAVLRRRKSV